MLTPLFHERYQLLYILPLDERLITKYDDVFEMLATPLYYRIFFVNFMTVNYKRIPMIFLKRMHRLFVARCILCIKYYSQTYIDIRYVGKLLGREIMDLIKEIKKKHLNVPRNMRLTKKRKRKLRLYDVIIINK